MGMLSHMTQLVFLTIKRAKLLLFAITQSLLRATQANTVRLSCPVECGRD